VYRKTQLTPDMAAQFVEGQNYVEKAFMSTSTKQNMPQFTGNASVVVESVTGRDITLLSKSAKEGEVLFPPGTTFLVTKKISSGPVHLIWMRQVAAGP
jgi:NAD:arginine ADP-ribosyltransferase.